MEVPVPLADWKPFFSCLIDTVSVLIDVRHKPLWKIAHNNANVRLKGTFELRVCSPLSSKITARVFSRNKGTTLMIEASIPKFLTGQNIVGREDLFAPCLEMILSVVNQMGIEPTPGELRKLRRGQFTMTRIDYAVHCSCSSPERAAALMAALRSLIFSKAKDASAYGIETVYEGQHSKYWTLRAYRKDLELDVRGRGLSANVYGRDHLQEMAQNCVRLELVLRSPKLKRLCHGDRDLSDPLAWSVDGARKRMQKWIDRLSQASGYVPDMVGMDELTVLHQFKLRAWLAGDLTAFTSSPTTLAATRKAILTKTGIDISGEPNVDLQQRAVKCIRDVFFEGIGFKSYPHKWAALCSGTRTWDGVGSNAKAVVKTAAKKR